MTAQSKPAPVVLTLSPMAPKGGKEGCYGYLVLTIDRNNCGSWSTACSMDLSLYCEAPGCWWSRLVEGPITAETFRVALQQHAADTLWPPDSDASQEQPSGASATTTVGNAHSDHSALSSIGGGEAATDVGSSRGTVPDGTSSIAGRRHLPRSTSGDAPDPSGGT